MKITFTGSGYNPPLQRNVDMELNVVPQPGDEVWLPEPFPYGEPGYVRTVVWYLQSGNPFVYIVVAPIKNPR
jgi:hypothetical protein